MLAVVSFLDLGFVVVRPPLGPPSPRDSPLFEQRPLVLPSGASEISSPSIFILQMRKLKPRKGGDKKPVVPWGGWVVKGHALAGAGAGGDPSFKLQARGPGAP